MKNFLFFLEMITIKVFRNYGNISEAKIYSQINLDFNANIFTFFVDSFENGKSEGFVMKKKIMILLYIIFIKKKSECVFG